MRIWLLLISTTSPPMLQLRNRRHQLSAWQLLPQLLDQVPGEHQQGIGAFAGNCVRFCAIIISLAAKAMEFDADQCNRTGRGGGHQTQRILHPRTLAQRAIRRILAASTDGNLWLSAHGSEERPPSKSKAYSNKGVFVTHPKPAFRRSVSLSLRWSADPSRVLCDRSIPD